MQQEQLQIVQADIEATVCEEMRAYHATFIPSQYQACPLVQDGWCWHEYQGTVPSLCGKSVCYHSGSIQVHIPDTHVTPARPLGAALAGLDAPAQPTA